MFIDWIRGHESDEVGLVDPYKPPFYIWKRTSGGDVVVDSDDEIEVAESV